MITKLLIGQISLFTLDQIFPMVRLTQAGFSVTGQFFQNQAGRDLFPVKCAALIAPRV
jgi:hypothetical protein